MVWTIANEKSNESSCRNQFTIKFPDPILEENIIYLALPLTSIPAGKSFPFSKPARILCLTITNIGSFLPSAFSAAIPVMLFHGLTISEFTIFDSPETGLRVIPLLSFHRPI